MIACVTRLPATIHSDVNYVCDKAVRCTWRYQWAKDVTRNKIPSTCGDM